MKWLKSKKEVEQEQSRLATTVSGNTAFALDLYHKLRSIEGNVIYSPFSISSALAMTFVGACADTKAQMAQALHFLLEGKHLHKAFKQLNEVLDEADRSGQIQVKVANTLWPRRGYNFLKTYLALVKRYYKSRITPVDFENEDAARQMINSWVQERTENKIRELIAPGVLDAATRLVLVNAIYFRGTWAGQFDAGLTSQVPFRAYTGGESQVWMMTRRQNYRYVEDQGLQIIELPYAGNDLSMLVLLPGQVDGLPALEESLTSQNLDQWMSNLQDTDVELFLPRFELSFLTRLDDTLKSMGMENAFSANADFSGMDGSRELYLGAVLHKAYIAVTEQGAEAAAATAVVMQTKSVAFPAVVFRADHPFIFFIRENRTGNILFLGRVSNPV